MQRDSERKGRKAKKRGRPSLRNGLAKRHLLSVRFSDAEWRSIQALSVQDGLTLSEWSRRTLLRAKDQVWGHQVK